MTKTIQKPSTNFLLFEHFPSPILVVADTGMVVYGNPAAQRLMGINAKELTSRSWAGIDAQLTLFSWKNNWNRLAAKGRIVYDTNLSTHGEFLRPIRASILRLDDHLAAVHIEDTIPQIQSVEQLQLLTKQSGLAYWSYNVIDHSWSSSPRVLSDLGLPTDLHLDRYTKDDLKHILGIHLQDKSQLELRQKFKEILISGGSFELELLFKPSAKHKRMIINGVAIGNGLHTTMINGTLSPGIDRDASDQELTLAKFSVDHSNDLIFWARPDGHFAFANQTVSTKLGYTAEELVDLPILQIAPYFDETVRARFWERLRVEQNFEEEFELTARDGKIITVLANVNYFKVNEQILACSFCRDITHSKARQFRQQLSESTLDSSRDMILWVDIEGQIKYFNQRFLQKTGYTPEQVYEMGTYDLFPSAKPEQKEAIWEVIRTNGHYELDGTLATADNVDLPVKAVFDYVSYQDKEFVCLYLQDYSKKKERDLILKLSNAAIQSAEEIVVWLEGNGHVKFLNKATLGYIGGKATDWQDKPLRKVFPQLNLDLLVPGASLEYSMPSVNGGTVYLELSIREVEQGEDRYLMLIGRNFTERYLRRQQIETAQQQIEELSSRLQEENLILREEVNEDYGIDNIITVSPKYQKVLQKISQVADTDTTVLILGETGTGKELLARAVHSLSEREDHPLIKVNCAALPENLIESELFGHEKGAFTGAHERKKGRFELAHQGTIFLDELGELPTALQAKLLRVLQEGEFERVGGTQTIKVDIRLIAATNRSLKNMVREGKFRADLYYRLNVFPIVNIPLRERPEDITVLTQYFVRKFAQRQGKTIDKINASDLKKLQHYRFPGNVRELENIIERSVVLCQGGVLNIPLDKDNSAQLNDQVFLTFDEMQRKYIIEALHKTNGRITGTEGAGRLLGMNDRTLMSKIRKFGIEKKEYLV